jgi:hypothetical protein
VHRSHDVDAGVIGSSVLVSNGSRCAKHRAEQRAKHGAAWQSFSQTAIREHVALYG